MSELKSIDELVALEAVKDVERHLQIQIDKPCAAVYFACKIFPPPGIRNQMFFALAAELRRVGVDSETALKKMTSYYESMPAKIRRAGGQDGQAFTYAEVKATVKSAYASDSVKAYGCKSGIWDATCPGPENCFFRKQLETRSGKKKQSRAAALYFFLDTWLPVGKLTPGALKTYLALDVIEAKRGYKPGSSLFVSWSEISRHGGITKKYVGQALENLFWHGLIAYKKGKPRVRGQPVTASEIKRVIPVPSPRN